MTGSWWSEDTVAVVTGANKGIGCEIVRQLADKGVTVVLTARDPARGQAAVDALKATGLKLIMFHALDISSPKSVDEFSKWLRNKFDGLDILVNNAAVYSANYSYETAKHILEINYSGTKSVTERLLPLMRASPAGARIVNVTSRAGQYEHFGGESLKRTFRDESNYNEQLIDSLAAKYLADMQAGRAYDEGWMQPGTIGMEMYSESKVFLNAYTVTLAKSLFESRPQNHQILVTSTCPGAVATDMIELVIEARGSDIVQGIPMKTVAEGADTAVWLALLPTAELVGKIGRFFGERQEYAFGLKAHD